MASGWPAYGRMARCRPAVDYGRAAIAALGDRIVYAQVNDFRRVGEKHEYVFTGEGDVDNTLMLRGLRQVGYEGYVGAENHRLPDERYDSRGIAEREHRLLRQLLVEIGVA